MTVAEKTASTSRSPRQVPSVIRISPSLATALLTEIQAGEQRQIANASVAAGLLFGTVRDREITIESCRPFAVADFYEHSAGKSELLDRSFEQCFAAAKDDRELARVDLIGWYGMGTSSDIALSDEEIEFHNRHFRRISDVALLAAPNAETRSLAFYTRWPNTAMSAERHRWAMTEAADEIATTEPIEVAMRARTTDDYRRRVYQVLDSLQEAQRTGKTIAFPAPQTSLGTSESARKQEQGVPRGVAAQPKWSEPPDASSSGFSASSFDTVSAGKRSRGTLWIASVIVLAFAVVVASTWFYLRKGAWPIRNLAAVAGQVAPSSTDLAMRVQAQGDTLLVSWDRQNEAIKSANSAVLAISDGARHREISLDASEIANGSLLYRPASSDVTVRLRVSGRHGLVSSENIRVLDGSDSAPGRKALEDPPSKTPAAAVIAGQGAVPAAANIGPRGEVIAAHSGTGKMPTSAQPVQLPISQVINREKQPRPGPKQAPAAQVAGAQAAPSAKPASNTAPQSKAVAELDARESATVRHESAVSRPAVARSRPVYVPPHPIKEVMPTGVFGQTAIYKPTRIAVQLRIDETGRVIMARPAENPSSADDALVRSALSAAKEWIFQPATIDGKNVPCDHVIEFRFTPEVR